VTYTDKWERLSDALNRVMRSTDLSREQAETDICRAMADGAIEFRARLASHVNGLQKSHQEVDGSDVRIPTQLKPHDLDWQKSRPTKPWPIGALSRHRSGLWHLEWIELSKGDVTRELLPSEKVIAPAKAPIETKRKKRETPKLDAARAALQTLFPEGIPPRHVLLDDQLVDRVSNYLKKNKLPHVSRDTILRAAKRK